MSSPRPTSRAVACCDADLVVVEADVEVDVLAVADQPVVGDDRDLRVGGGLQLRWTARCRRSAAMISSVGALGDHLVDLLRLGGDVVAGVLQVDLVALASSSSSLTALPSAIHRSEVWVGIATPIGQVAPGLASLVSCRRCRRPRRRTPPG